MTMARPAPPTARREPGNRQRLVLALISLAVLLLKWRLLASPVTEDVGQFEEAGFGVTLRGLGKAYGGVYFPIQWQLFGWTWVLARETDSAFYLICKLVNLLFDLGSFALVILLLRRLGRSLWYSLLYWAHPWFIVVFSLGYIDFEFGFFVLLALYLATALKEARSPLRYHLLVGTPIAIAFLMKPQVQVIVLALGVYALFDGWRRRTLRSFAVLLPSVVLFAGYSTFFVLNGRSLLYLGRGYVALGDWIPCLTAHMLNLWYPLAYALKQPGDPIFAISDKVLLTPWGLEARTVGTAVSVGLVVWFAWLQARRRPVADEPGSSLGALLAFATIVPPFTMTMAHENHGFIGSICLLLHVARSRERSLFVIWHGIVLLQFVNLFILYGTGPLAAWLCERYSYGLRTSLAVVDSLLFLGLLYTMLAPLLRDRRESSRACASAASLDRGQSPL